MWQIIHCERPDKFRHTTKQARLQGVYYFYYGISVLIPFVMKFVHETKTKYEDKNHSKTIQNA